MSNLAALPSDAGHGWRYLVPAHATGALPPGAAGLERDGYALLRRSVPQALVTELRERLARETSAPPTDVDRFYARYLDPGVFRCLLFERDPLFQRMIAWPPVLAAIEPLLGVDCHVIANTGWNTPSGYPGGPWHTDAGPLVPRPAGVPWDDRVPYPIFAIGCMIYLTDVGIDQGPTAVVPGSHRSGRPAPDDPEPTWEGRGPLALTAEAGDIALFASDLWHRGLPHRSGGGRMVFQVHYGRRDIATRFAPEINRPLASAAVERALDERARRLIGLHPMNFYG